MSDEKQSDDGIDWGEQPFINEPSNPDHFQYVPSADKPHELRFSNPEGLSEPSAETSEVPIISASSNDFDENDNWTDNEADELYDDSDYIARPKSPAAHTWRFIGEVVFYSLLAVAAIATIALLVYVSLRSWEVPVPAIVTATIILLISVVWLYAHYMRRADRRWDESNLPEPDEEILYDRIPHISMFLNSIVIQAAIWVISFAIISITLNLIGSRWYWHVLVQAIVTAINAYFVTRTYVNWTKTRYIVTRASVIIMRPDLFWLRLRNNPRKEILAHTLVDHGRKKSTLSEKFAYNTRGTAMLTTQEEGTGSTITLPYISGIEHFIDAASASRKAGRQ